MDARSRVFVLPLFGDKLPPLRMSVSAAIFRFLTNADLHNASLVNRLWNQVALGDSVWDHANFVPAGQADGDNQAEQDQASSLTLRAAAKWSRRDLSNRWRANDVVSIVYPPPAVDPVS